MSKFILLLSSLVLLGACSMSYQFTKEETIGIGSKTGEDADAGVGIVELSLSSEFYDELYLIGLKGNRNNLKTIKLVPEKSKSERATAYFISNNDKELKENLNSKTLPSLVSNIEGRTIKINVQNLNVCPEGLVLGMSHKKVTKSINGKKTVTESRTPLINAELYSKLDKPTCLYKVELSLSGVDGVKAYIDGSQISGFSSKNEQTESLKASYLKTTVNPDIVALPLMDIYTSALSL